MHPTFISIEDELPVRPMLLPQEVGMLQLPKSALLAGADDALLTVEAGEADDRRAIVGHGNWKCSMALCLLLCEWGSS